MKQKAPSKTAWRVADLPQNTPTVFSIRPLSSQLQEIANALGLLTLHKLSFEGTISAVGDADWSLRAKLGATVSQPCAVTLAPVKTRIDEEVLRLYQQDFVEIDLPEVEMPEDDTLEPLTGWIDPEAVMLEALALALPLYPRAPGAELGELRVSAPGIAPLSHDDAKPFAGLADLKDALSRRDETDDN